MNKHPRNQYHHVCPRKCYSTCTMISHVENDRIVHLNVEPNHPYTKGKLCAKGYAYIERNYHPDRLKYPYYQKVKGSGDFKQITWEEAYNLILSEMVNIHEIFGNFLPLAFYKGSGNIGVHHYASDHFFASLGGTTRITNSSHPLTCPESITSGTGTFRMSHPTIIGESNVIIVWGANPAATNIHLIPILIEAKIKGAKLVVIDPLYTQTAELADLYIQIQPSTDGELANCIIKSLSEMNAIDSDFINQHSLGFHEYLEQIRDMDKQKVLLKCDISEKPLDILLDWLKEARAVSHIIGSGLQRHFNGEQTIRSIEALAAVRGDIGKIGGGIFLGFNQNKLFDNQQFFETEQANSSYRILNINQLNESTRIDSNQPPVQMLWIACANPLNQEPNSNAVAQYLREIPFVITVDHFLTSTAMMSNLVLPTTTHFEELDIVPSFWHNSIALNEQAITPYYQSKSDWNIMRELAKRLNKYDPDVCSFPLHSSEEEYLNSQFNEKVRNLYHIHSISDLRGHVLTPDLSAIAWGNKQFDTTTGKYQFYSSIAQNEGYSSMPLFKEGKAPTRDYPFWLITSHNPYMFNSQFQFLNLSEEGEAFVYIHPEAAKELKIMNNEIVKIFNEQDSIEIKASYSSIVPRDILLVYQGWYPDSRVNINCLVSPSQTDLSGSVLTTKGIAFYDTFVNIGKL